jgi:tRNA nucleotidyltransferase (CCA-adding enzyme)
MEPVQEDVPNQAGELLERLGREPGGAQLLALAPRGAFLVGGAVRDLLLGRRPRELDVVLVDERSPFGHAVAHFAGKLASSFGVPAGSSEHESFGTAIVEWEGGRIDIAAARRERYQRPGALPEVEGAPLAEDLLRRDFTINAIAVGLVGSEREALRAAPHALEDLRAGRLRVLHARSFLDDPTRLWRLGRYTARLGFALEESTAQLARDAVAAGALETVSGARVGAELRLALGELDALEALGELDRLGVLGALHPRLRFEPELVRRGVELLEADRGRAGAGPGRADVLMLASLLLPLTLRADAAPMGGTDTPLAAGAGAGPLNEAGRRLMGGRGAEVAALLDRLEFAAAVRDRVVAAAVAATGLTDTLAESLRPSELRAAVLRVPPEGVALAGALSEAAAGAARRWLAELRHVGLLIGGEDLLAGGIPEGPEVGRRLEEVLEMRLDGELGDERESQLRAALAV